MARLMVVTRYGPGDEERWNAFVRNSKNATFLLDRRYMDYHADRFRDHSLLFNDERERLIAVMPAHEMDDTLASHEGLTYGGVVSGASMSAPAMLDVFDAARRYLRANGFRHLAYKTIPHIYHRLPAEEDRYALFRLGARRTRVDLLSTVAMADRLPLQERRRRQIKSASKLSLQVEESADFRAFWPLLECSLHARHNVTPVHRADEIQLLHDRFPDRIRLYVCKDMTEVLAGVVVYDTDTVAHAQYIASTERGRQTGALDYLIAALLDTHYAHKRFFDLGSSTEAGGSILNVGLTEQKEGFGARAIAHESYSVEIS
jgi:hypothetical protein